MKHDCETWYDEGRGCSICSALLRHEKHNIKELQEYTNAYILEQKKEINRLHKIIKKLKKGLA